MGVTIATHNGSKVCREHNIRNERVVSKEAHIDTNGVHEVWRDEKPREAYERLFGDACKAYNAKQSRDDRKITSYYNEVCKDAKKHPVYEIIAGVYGKDENGVPICSEEKGKAILRDYVNTWEQRNPNLVLIGAYYHADEQGEPHAHLDYIPVAHGYTKGLETQNGLVKALGEQGFEKKGRATAQIQWEAKENAAFEAICKEYGLEVDHPREEGRQHLATEQYKAEKALESTIEHYKSLDRVNEHIKADTERLKKENVKANEATARAVSRKLKATKLKQSPSNPRAYAYDRDFVQELKAIAKEVKEEAKVASRTDESVQVRYDEASLVLLNAQKEAEELKEKAEKEVLERVQLGDTYMAQAQEYKEDMENYILGTADAQFKKFLEERFHGESDRFTDLCEFIKGIGGGEEVLKKFHAWEKEQEEVLEHAWHMSR